MERRRGRPPGGDGAETRDRLLDAALELFAEQGYAATTVRQIAAAVGLRDSAIYGHFSGKRAIYDALFAEAGPPSLETLNLDVEEIAATDPRQAVRHLVDLAYEGWSTHRARRFASMVIREGSGSEAMERVAEGIDALRDQLAEPFRRWQLAGLIRADLSPRQLVWELFSALQAPRLVHLRAGASDSDLAIARQMFDDHVEFFLSCVTTTEGSR